LLLRKCFFVSAVRNAAGGSTVQAGRSYPLKAAWNDHS